MTFLIKFVLINVNHPIWIIIYVLLCLKWGFVQENASQHKGENFTDILWKKEFLYIYMYINLILCWHI